MLFKLLLLPFFLFAVAHAAEVTPTKFSFPAHGLIASLTWNVDPQAEKDLPSGEPDPASASVAQVQWSASPGPFRLDVSMDMGGSPMTAPSPGWTQGENAAAFRTCSPNQNGCAPTLLFSMSGAWELCFVLHPEQPDKETACTPLQVP